MNITKEIIDYDKHKKNIDKWINIKGEIKYLEFAKGLQRLILDCCDIEYTKEEQACK